jgi:hypothetical protein
MAEFHHHFGDQQDTIKGPYNRCIYCGSDTDLGRLTDEHALAETLGGRLVLLKASCLDCNNKINRFESRVHNQMFADVRAHLGIRKTKSKGRRSLYPVQIIVDDVQKTIRVPIDKHPTMLWLPSFPLPGIMTRDEPSSEFKNPHLWAWSLGPKEEYERKLAEIKKATGASQAFHHGTIIAGAFARYLAKTVHCAAIAIFGIDSFIGMLPPIILDEKSPVAYLVGTLPEWGPVKSSEAHYDFTFQIGVDQNTGRKLLLCSARLFAWLVTPIYEVVVGEPRFELELLLS